MRPFVPPLVLIAVAALLFSSVAPAGALGCPAPVGNLRETAADLIVVGEIESEAERTYTFTVERYLKGSGPAAISVDRPPSEDPTSPFVYMSPDRKLLLFLLEDAGGPEAYRVMPCAGGSLPDGDANINAYLASTLTITGPGQPPYDAEPEPAQLEPPDDAGPPAQTDGESTDALPRAPMWAAAIVLPLLFLAGAMLLASRRR